MIDSPVHGRDPHDAVAVAQPRLDATGVAVAARQRNLAVFTTAAVVVIVLDQLSKSLVRGWLAPGQSWPAANTFVGRFYSFTHVHNTGVAFGLFQGRSEIHLAVSLLVVAVLLVYRRRLPADALWANLALGMIVAGALGNVVDRVRIGHVTDFLDFKFWPVFNVADSCVFLGTVLLMFLLWREDRARPAGAPVVGASEPLQQATPPAQP